jgi:hypothetical protein
MKPKLDRSRFSGAKVLLDRDYVQSSLISMRLFTVLRQFWSVCQGFGSPFVHQRRWTLISLFDSLISMRLNGGPWPSWASVAWLPHGENPDAAINLAGSGDFNLSDIKTVKWSIDFTLCSLVFAILTLFNKEICLKTCICRRKVVSLHRK